jgi:PLP dependent protein
VGVAEGLLAVRSRIVSAGGDLAVVKVVAVTKGFPVDAVREALDAGIADIGENYAWELLAKSKALGRGPGAPRWHFLGAVQRNKVTALAPQVELWQSVAREVEAAAISKAAPGASILVQVDPTGLGGRRNGVAPEEAIDLVRAAERAGLDVRGLMVVGPPGPAEDARPSFRRVAELAKSLGLAEISMGMSADLEVAVEEGATMIRVGRALFGPRAGPPIRASRQ